VLVTLPGQHVLVSRQANRGRLPLHDFAGSLRHVVNLNARHGPIIRPARQLHTSSRSGVANVPAREPALDRAAANPC